MLNGYDAIESEPSVFHQLLRMEGAGAATPDKEVGSGISVAYVSTGRYRVTWSDKQGDFLGHTFGFQASTPANVDGWTCVCGAYDATNRQIDLYIYSDTPALADLAASTWLFVDLRFRRTRVGG